MIGCVFGPWTYDYLGHSRTKSTALILILAILWTGTYFCCCLTIDVTSRGNNIPLLGRNTLCWHKSEYRVQRVHIEKTVAIISSLFNHSLFPSQSLVLLPIHNQLEPLKYSSISVNFLSFASGIMKNMINVAISPPIANIKNSPDILIS